MADETKAAEPPAAPAKSFARRDRLTEIELWAQAKWATENTIETDHTKKVKASPDDKYMVTFPYPYMNGKLHLGHAFTVTKAEFAVRYRRLKGANALFPFAFHCTGMPIQAAANRLKREMDQYGNPPVFPTEEEEQAAAATKASTPAEGATVPPTGKFKGKKTKAVAKSGGKKQWEILDMMVPTEEVPKFTDAMHWLQYFPPYGMEDLKRFGCHIDWRRSFITTDVNPFYDRFIGWQFRLLKAGGRTKFGKRPNIYSCLDGQVCADHDRASGEGVNPQEYTLIKLEVLDLPEGHVLTEAKSKFRVFLAAATLRPETMYGQTNCFVLPDGDYGAFQINDTDVFVISERAAKNLAHQRGGYPGYSPDASQDKGWGEPVKLADCKGTELLGLPLKGPNAKYDVVYTLPLLTIKMNKGTGVVTSVPSDAPDDWAALRDLQQKPKLREKFGITDEMVMPFEVVPIIEIPGYGQTSAVKVCDDLKIKSQNDAAKLKEAKELVYLKGFYEGVMLVGSQAGKKVCDAKEGVRQELLDSGEAIKYFEPENMVMGRSGDECIVAETDQWYLSYGEDDWRQKVEEHIKSENFTAYTPQAFQKFEYTVGWLKEWAFSRLFGLGTRVPWQREFVIESLSDSTIYMAYYTIAHILQGEGNLDGTKPGPRGIKPEDMTDEVFNYIFLQGPMPDGCGIAQETMEEMRNEFEYWYPMDMRVSGKDLITNHLTMSLYNHAEIWKDRPEMWPRSMYGNGHVMVDAEKMSKSKGNFLMLLQCCEEYGADATRFACADAGDGLEDSNFARETANAAILKLNTEMDWIASVAGTDADGADMRDADSEHNFADRAFLNAVANLVDQCDNHYQRIEYRLSLKTGFSQMLLERNFYRDNCAKSGIGMHRGVVKTFCEALVICNAPIIPHWSEKLWEILGKEGCACAASWPTFPAVDPVLLASGQYLQDAVDSLREQHLKVTQAKKGKKKGKGGGAAAAPPAAPTHAHVYIASEYEDWKQKALSFLAGVWDDDAQGGANQLPASKELMGALKGFVAGDDELKKKTKFVMQFASFVVKNDVPARGRAAFDLVMPFSEADILRDNTKYIEQSFGLKAVQIFDVSTDKDVPGDAKKQQQASPAKPSVNFYVEE